MSKSALVSIADVAAAAGVSAATVSRALNGTAPVSDDTAARVRAAATRLGYSPQRMRELRSRTPGAKRTRAIGVLLPELYGEFFAELIRGIDHAAREMGYVVLVTSGCRDAADVMTALYAIRKRVDGYLAVSPSRTSLSGIKVLAARFPTVLLNVGANVGRFATVAVDDAGGASAMMEHLLSLGHRRVLFLRGPADDLSAHERLTAVRAVARRNADCGLTEQDGEFRRDTAYDAVSAVLRDGPRPDVVFAANDSMAVGAIAAVRDADLRVPEDIAVVGFDDTPTAHYLAPPLTTVKFPIYELGQQAARRLIRALTGEEKLRPLHQSLPTKIVVRASCGAVQRMMDGAPNGAPDSGTAAAPDRVGIGAD